MYKTKSKDNKKTSALISSRELQNVAEDMDGFLNLIFESYISNLQVLVFCSSRVACQSTAVNIVKALQKFHFNDLPQSELYNNIPNNQNQITQSQLSHVVQDLQDVRGGLSNEILDYVIPYQVSYHHAGLLLEERQIIENAFKNKQLKVMIATTTLAAGVNLPVQRVIIKSLKQGPEFISRSQYLQMIGRAGRSGYCDYGESYICARITSIEYIADLLENEENDKDEQQLDKNTALQEQQNTCNEKEDTQMYQQSPQILKPRSLNQCLKHQRDTDKVDDKTQGKLSDDRLQYSMQLNQLNQVNKSQQLQQHRLNYQTTQEEVIISSLDNDLYVAGQQFEEQHNPTQLQKNQRQNYQEDIVQQHQMIQNSSIYEESQKQSCKLKLLKAQNARQYQFNMDDKQINQQKVELVQNIQTQRVQIAQEKLIQNQQLSQEGLKFDEIEQFISKYQSQETQKHYADVQQRRNNQLEPQRIANNIPKEDFNRFQMDFIPDQYTYDIASRQVNIESQKPSNSSKQQFKEYQCSDEQTNLHSKQIGKKGLEGQIVSLNKVSNFTDQIMGDTQQVNNLQKSYQSIQDDSQCISITKSISLQRCVLENQISNPNLQDSTVFETIKANTSTCKDESFVDSKENKVQGSKQTAYFKDKECEQLRLVMFSKLPILESQLDFQNQNISAAQNMYDINAKTFQSNKQINSKTDSAVCNQLQQQNCKRGRGEIISSVAASHYQPQLTHLDNSNLHSILVQNKKQSQFYIYPYISQLLIECFSTQLIDNAVGVKKLIKASLLCLIKDYQYAAQCFQKSLRNLEMNCLIRYRKIDRNQNITQFNQDSLHGIQDSSMKQQQQDSIAQQISQQSIQQIHKWSMLPKGYAVYNSSLPPQQALNLYFEIKRALNNLVLGDSTQIIYIILLDNPFQIQNWSACSLLLRKLNKYQRKVAQLLGLTQLYADKKAQNSIFHPNSALEASFSQFLIACYMSDIVNGVMHSADAIIDLSNLMSYKILLGQIQQLQGQISKYAYMAAQLCRSQQWWMMETLFHSLSMRAITTSNQKIETLMEIPDITPMQARALFNSGFKTLESLLVQNNVKLFQKQNNLLVSYEQLDKVQQSEIQQKHLQQVAKALKESLPRNLMVGQTKRSQFQKISVGIAGNEGINAMLFRQARKLISSANNTAQNYMNDFLDQEDNLQFEYQD